MNGNPCNRCPACLGIENGSILDVLELDAASNNGVDQVRALRDEAVYTPPPPCGSVCTSWMRSGSTLSTPAFNALLKILEEPRPPDVHSCHHRAAQGPGHHQVPVPAVFPQADPPRDRSPSALAMWPSRRGST